MIDAILTVLLVAIAVLLAWLAYDVGALLGWWGLVLALPLACTVGMLLAMAVNLWRLRA